MRGTPTLLLDGIWGRPKRFNRLIDALRDAGLDARIHEYDSSGRIPLDTLGQELCSVIRDFGRPVRMLGFSMGGIVIRAAKMLDAKLPIERAVFLNSPHYGTAMAHLIPFGAVKQMRPTDPFMERLESAEWDVPTLATWCPFDTMVVPGRHAKWERAEETIRCDVPVHIWPVHSPFIRKRIVEFLSVDQKTSDAPAAKVGGQA